MSGKSKGEVVALCASSKRGTRKEQAAQVRFVEDWGIGGDAHAGKWHRQISLIPLEEIESFRSRGADVAFGDFGENVVVKGFDLKSYPPGTKFTVGETEIEITQIGKECHNHCAIFQRMGDCIMPREGVFAKVLRGGDVKEGDAVLMEYKAAVITVSDKCAAGQREDTSGPAVCGMLRENGYDVIYTAVVPDEADRIKEELIRCADDLRCALVLTSGGTGLSVRDITPEATKAVISREVPGIPEEMRRASMEVTPYGCLSRSAAGIRGRTLIINLPGSVKAARENFSAVIWAVRHGLDTLYTDGSTDGLHS